MAVLPPDPIFILRSSEMGAVNSICCHNDERLLAGTAKGTIHLWDLQTNRSPLHFDIGSSNPVTTLHHIDDCLISQEKGGQIKFWSLTNTKYELKTSIDCNHMGFCRCDIGQNILAFPKHENEICLASLETAEIFQTLKPTDSAKTGNLTAIRICNIHGQNYILAGYDSGDLLIWDLRSYKVLNENRIFEGEMITSIDYDVFTNRGICGGSGDKIAVFSYTKQTTDEDNSMNLVRKSDIGIKNPGINCLKIRHDQKIFVSGGWDGRIRLFSWKSLRPLAVLTEHKNGGVMDICFSTRPVQLWKASIMAACGVDGQITLWDLYNK